MNLQPKNVSSILAVGEDLEYVLFKTAISSAENGQHVWFISPQTLNKTPKNIKPPDKEILQLITFMYLKDYKDFVTHLNSIHLWRNIPNVIIVTGYEIYCNFASSNYNSLKAALIATSLLDNAAVCAKKTNQKLNLLVTCAPPADTDLSKLQVLKDLYFNSFLYKDVSEEFYQKITDLLK